MSIAKVETGSLIVIGSGTVTSFENEPIEITLEPEKAGAANEDERLTFVFEFIDDGDEAGIKTTTLSDKSIKYKIYNHRNTGIQVGGITPPTGPVNPIQIGRMDGRNLYLYYQIESRETDEHEYTTTFHYTFYKGEEIDGSE